MQHSKKAYKEEDVLLVKEREDKTLIIIRLNWEKRLKEVRTRNKNLERKE